MRFIAIIIFLGMLCSCHEQNEKEQRIHNYLQKKYEQGPEMEDGFEIINEGIFFDAKYPPDLIEIKSEFLETKTGYKFYKTILLTTYLEYMSVDLIVACSIFEGGEVIELESPTFSKSNIDFINIFSWLDFASDEEKISFVNSVSDLFKLIVQDGKIRNFQKAGEDYQCELWHGHLKWRILNFDFEGDKLMELTYLQSQ